MPRGGAEAFERRGARSLPTHPIARLNSMAAEKIGDGDRLLARGLHDLDRDRALAGRDDKPVIRGHEHFASNTLHLNDRGFVDDQPKRLLRSA